MVLHAVKDYIRILRALRVANLETNMCWNDTACDLTTSVRGRFSSLEWQHIASRIVEHAQRCSGAIIS